MKEFIIPEMESVYFTRQDLIATSTCTCVDCQECPEGKDNCQCLSQCQWLSQCGTDN